MIDVSIESCSRWYNVTSWTYRWLTTEIFETKRARRSSQPTAATAVAS